MGVEYWDLKNIVSKFGCYKRCREAALAKARRMGVDIIIRHHGARATPNRDPQRVNQWARTDGQIVYNRDADGNFVDVDAGG